MLGLSHSALVTNNAHAICNGRRMASDAMQWHIIDTAQQECDIMRREALGLQKLAESRRSGVK